MRAGYCVFAKSAAKAPVSHLNGGGLVRLRLSYVCTTPSQDCRVSQGAGQDRRDAAHGDSRANGGVDFRHAKVY